MGCSNTRNLDREFNDVVHIKKLIDDNEDRNLVDDAVCLRRGVNDTVIQDRRNGHESVRSRPHPRPQHTRRPRLHHILLGVHGRGPLFRDDWR